MAPIKSFYDAFVARDGAAMAALYSDDVEFCDPVFPKLRGQEAKAMWQMLCQRGADLEIKYEIISSDGNTHKVRWDAHYMFTNTGRKVHNKVLANLTVHNGKIVKHIDEFDFWRWSMQALGMTGLLLGWTPAIKRKVQDQAIKSLHAYMSKIMNQSGGTN